MLLAGDVGGTKTALALFDGEGRSLRLVREAVLPSHDFDSLEGAIERFLGEGARPEIDAACLGVAGPVVDGRSTATNLPWHVDERVLTYAIPAGRVRLVNDLEAAAHGVLALDEADLRMLQSGVPRRGHIALIAAGTGLGEAIIVSDGAGHRSVIATEGGHADFAPCDELQDGLLRHLRKEFGRVSYERVLSGPGLVNIYRFLREIGAAPEARAVAERMSAGDAGAAVTEAALAGDPLSSRTLDVFVSIYGAEAGNLALKGLTVGGVVIGGGIAPRIVDRLGAGGFVAAFRAKGRLAALMEAMPITVAMETRAPLLGAAHVAAHLR
ncbi:MAG TPA: glucokinase [Methylomirabilota bacterium]|jgi:glucokinase|nr:glucokinase [Methylomirabilota bacterium]